MHAQTKSIDIKLPAEEVKKAHELRSEISRS